MNRDALGTLLLVVGVSVAAVGCAPSVSGPPPSSTDPVVVDADDLEWSQRPSGVRVAVLHGDPDAPGPFVLRLQYPAGYRKEPHYHPRDAFVTVLAGSYHRGYGEVFEESTAHELRPGTFSLNPGGVSHYEWTTAPATLEVHAIGPWKTVYVDAGRPADDAS